VKAIPEGYTEQGERRKYNSENFHICNGSDEDEKGVQDFVE
jgi:hypothetical protein